MQRKTWTQLVIAFAFALGTGVVVAVGGGLVGGRGDLVVGSIVGTMLAAFLLTYLALGHQNSE
jgi:hypothetical protein